MCVLKGTLLGVGGSDEVPEDVILPDAGLPAWLGGRAPGHPAEQPLTWQWSPGGKLRRPGLEGRHVQAQGPLVRWGQQCRGPWWLEVVDRGLRWGDPSLGRWRVEGEAPAVGGWPQGSGADGWVREGAGGGLLQEGLVGRLGGGLGSTPGLGLPRGCRGSHGPLRLGLRRPELLLQRLLLEWLVVGEDLPDAVDKVSLVSGDEAHEDLPE